MRTHSGSNPQRTVTLAIPFAMAAWLVTVPGVFSLSSFLAVAALLIGLFWVATVTYADGQPTATLAQALPDAGPGASLKPRREGK